MDEAYSFSKPKAFEALIVTIGTTPTLVKLGLCDNKFHPGTTRVRMQNTGSDNVYWAWSDVTPGDYTHMARIPPDASFWFNWDSANLDMLWICGDTVTSKVVILQEGK